MNTEELRARKVDKVVDARGVVCPGPLLEAMRMVPAAPIHGVMEVVTSYEGTTEDVPRWARQVGNDHLGTVADAGVRHIYLRRGK